MILTFGDLTMQIEIIDLIVLMAVGVLILIMLGITIWSWRLKSSAFTKRQKIRLTYWLLIAIIATEFLILMLPNHDRNIMFIIVAICISIWALYVFRDGKLLDETSQNIAVTLFILACFVIIYGFDYIYPIHTNKQFISDFYANGGAELVSIAITVILLDRLNDRKNAEERLEELKVRLRSPNPHIVIEAIQMLDAKSWLDDVLQKSLEDGIDIILPDGKKWTPDRDMQEFTDSREWRTKQINKIIDSAKVQKAIENHNLDLIQVAPEYHAYYPQVELRHHWLN